METERLVLRKPHAGDLPLLFSILSDPVTMAHWPAPLDQSQFANWFPDVEPETHNPGRFVVERKADKTVLGTVGLLTLEVDGASEHDLGYIIHHPYWRQGYALEAARALLTYGHEILGFSRIVASMADDNLPSAGVARRLGMSETGSFQNIRNRGKTHLLFLSHVD